MAWDGEVFAQPNRLEDSSLTTRQVWNRLSSGRLTWREAFQILNRDDCAAYRKRIPPLSTEREEFMMHVPLTCVRLRPTVARS